MRKILCLPLLTAVCALTSLRADLTIVEHCDSTGEPTSHAEYANSDTAVMFKDGYTRFDYSPAESRIRDLKSGETFDLMHAQKSYIKMPGETALATPDAAKQSPGTTKDAGTPLTPTGRTETISGYAADECAGVIAGIKITMWLSKAVPDYAHILREMSAVYPPVQGSSNWRSVWGLDLATLPGFPVRTVYEFGSGHTLTLTVVSINTRPIADSEFDIPADYKPAPAPDAAKPAGQ